jgi:hypothetical protein
MYTKQQCHNPPSPFLDHDVADVPVEGPTEPNIKHKSKPAGCDSYLLSHVL